MIKTDIFKTTVSEGDWIPIEITIKDANGMLPELVGMVTIKSKGKDVDGKMHDIKSPINSCPIQGIPLNYVLRSGNTFQSFMQDFCGLAEDIRLGILPVEE